MAASWRAAAAQFGAGGVGLGALVVVAGSSSSRTSGTRCRDRGFVPPIDFSGIWRIMASVPTSETQVTANGTG